MKTTLNLHLTYAHHSSDSVLKDEWLSKGLAGPAPQALRIAKGGLERRGTGEEVFLKTLMENAESGVTMADQLLLNYKNEWEGARLYHQRIVKRQASARSYHQPIVKRQASAPVPPTNRKETSKRARTTNQS
eukprot:9482885-Pyramimonas_sp.AAC.1